MSDPEELVPHPLAKDFNGNPWMVPKNPTHVWMPVAELAALKAALEARFTEADVCHIVYDIRDAHDKKHGYSDSIDYGAEMKKTIAYIRKARKEKE